MVIDIKDAERDFSKLIESLVDRQEDEVIISINGKPAIKMEPINKRVGIAKEEMSDFDVSVEELDSIPVEDFGI